MAAEFCSFVFNGELSSDLSCWQVFSVGGGGKRKIKQQNTQRNFSKHSRSIIHFTGVSPFAQYVPEILPSPSFTWSHAVGAVDDDEDDAETWVSWGRHSRPYSLQQLFTCGLLIGSFFSSIHQTSCSACHYYRCYIHLVKHCMKNDIFLMDYIFTSLYLWFKLAHSLFILCVYRAFTEQQRALLMERRLKEGFSPLSLHLSQSLTPCSPFWCSQVNHLGKALWVNHEEKAALMLLKSFSNKWWDERINPSSQHCPFMWVKKQKTEWNVKVHGEKLWNKFYMSSVSRLYKRTALGRTAVIL